MKLRKYFPVLLFLILILFGGCSTSAKAEVKKAVTNELDLLKNLDPDTTQEYISYQDLFQTPPRLPTFLRRSKKPSHCFLRNLTTKSWMSIWIKIPIRQLPLSV